MANNKNILVVQPPGLERESILILLYDYTPDIADTIDAAENNLQTATARYHFIFLAGFPVAGMERIIKTIENHPIHGTTDIIASVESMDAWHTLRSPLLSIAKKGDNGWNIRSLLGSLLPAKKLV